MTQTSGEKELVLGNKQLISLFFVVVALCGVFFAMGYMVRGNSLKGSVGTTTDSTSLTSGDSAKRPQPEAQTDTTGAPPAASASSEAPAGDNPASETRPAQDTAVPSTVADTKVEPRPAKMETSSPASISPVEAGASYVQVGALGRSDAESTVRTLREQHLPALVAASSKEGLYRVLVGPYHLTADVADAKAKLKELGFSNTIVQRQ